MKTISRSGGCFPRGRAGLAALPMAGIMATLLDGGNRIYDGLYTPMVPRGGGRAA